MNVEIISIGDELLIGQTVNTNSSWIGKELSNIGARILKTISIADEKQEILESLKEIKSYTDCVIITGGLGPTKDDITKHTLCEFFNTSLEIHEPTLQKIKEFFARRNRPMLESNNLQAELPKSCHILENNYGTAAGMWFDHDNTIFISLPGVPYEMKGIMSEEVIPKLKSQFELQSMFYKTAMTQGIGESFLAEKIKDWEDKIYESGYSLAYLPSPGIVKLRITSPFGNKDESAIDKLFKELEIQIPRYFFGYDSDTLASVIGEKLKCKNLTLGTVESCTSGKLASTITEVPGASKYYMGSLLTYSNQLKHKLAKVSNETIIKYGSVSEEVALEMAQGGRNELGVDICISTTGIAGPDGGSKEKPVGLVWIAIATPEKITSHRLQFSQHRGRNINMTTLSALNLLRIALNE